MIVGTALEGSAEVSDCDTAIKGDVRLEGMPDVEGILHVVEGGALLTMPVQRRRRRADTIAVTLIALRVARDRG